MKNKLFLATAILAFAACSENTYMGDQEGNVTGSGAITFGFDMQNGTRAGDIMGNEAAKLLGNNFYVTGTKGTEAETSPSPTLVFDNYLVHYDINSAGKTTSNTANWEYVGVTPDDTNYDKLGNYQTGEGHSGQTIKFWDYSVAQYDFLAFSTGTYKAKKGKTNPGEGEIGVTEMKYGTDLAGSKTAYTFFLPSEDALSNVYISDITKVPQANFGKEVSLKFKNLGSKVRVALYETVPGYSVKDVKFYTVDGTNDFTGSKGNDAALIFTEGGELTVKGTVEVSFPYVGVNNSPEATSPNTPNPDYNKASAKVEAGTESTDKTRKKTFGTLNLVAKQADEAGDNNVFLGRSLPTASFAGDAAKQFYKNVFPSKVNAPITLRVDYTLVPIDGAAETIEVKGAKAVVPATYTKWLPNYAYTYIFKISDNTNGWTGTASQPSGLFPITFDAVVTAATDATDEQATITTVATPSITTYQQGHDWVHKDEYSKSQKAGADQTNVKDLYIQVMDNSAVTSALVTDLNGTNKSLLFAVSKANASEAEVMDALLNRTNSYGDANPKGRNGITLTTNANISNTETSIVNGVNDQPITVTAGTAAKIDIDQLTASTYAYVYCTTVPSSEEKIYQVATVSGSTNEEKNTDAQKYYEVNPSSIVAETSDDDKAKAGKVYFVKNADNSYTFKQTKVGDDVTGLYEATIPGSKATSYTADNIYFDVYNQNDGAYAVKVIKVVE